MATATQTTKNFIDGDWVDPAEGRTDPVYNPATGEELAQAPSSTAEDVDRAVKAARAAFESGWATTTPAERSLALLRLADAVEEHADEIAELESANAAENQPDEEALPWARYMRDTVIVAMAGVRGPADKLERIIADDLWPLPKYSEILFIK